MVPLKNISKLDSGSEHVISGSQIKAIPMILTKATSQEDLRKTR